MIKISFKDHKKCQFKKKKKKTKGAFILKKKGVKYKYTNFNCGLSGRNILPPNTAKWQMRKTAGHVKIVET